jgi:hypothetical protein
MNWPKIRRYVSIVLITIIAVLVCIPTVLHWIVLLRQ